MIMVFLGADDLANDKIRVFLIEDDSDDAELIKLMLTRFENAQFIFNHAKNLEDGLARFKKSNYDVILLDLGLPDCTGFDTFIQTRDQVSKKPIIILTGLFDEDLGVKAVREGAQDYLVKGEFDRKLLVRSIEYSIERKHAENALRESEDRFRIIFEAAEDSIFIKDNSLRYLHVNPAMERLLDFRASDIIGKTDLDIFGEEATAHIEELDARVLNGEIVHDEHTKPVRGIPTTFNVIKVPIYDSSGEITGLCGIARDVTKQIEIKKDLIEKKNKLKTLIENSTFGLMLVDKDGTNKYINPKFREIFGYDLNEIPNEREWFHKAFSNPEYRNEAKKWIDNFKGAKVGEKKSRTFKVTCNDGQEKIIDFTPVLLETGEYLMSVEDITYFDKAEKALIKSEERFRTVARSAVDAIIITDANGNIVFCNDSVRRIFDYYEKEITGQNIDILMPGLHRDYFPINVYRQMNNEKKFISGKVFESYGFRKDGSEFPIEISITHWEAEGEKFTTSIIRDITNRKLTEYRLKMREELFCQMAENIEEVFWIIDPLMSQILYISPAYERIWGRTCESLYNNPKSWIKSINPQDREKFIEIIFGRTKEVRRGRKEGIEYRIQRPDGSERWIRARTFPVIYKNKETYRIVGIAHDITELKEIQEKMEKILGEKEILFDQVKNQ